jgi:hypothetical protein
VHDDRSNVLAELVRFSDTLRLRPREVTMPSSSRHTAEQVVAEVKTLSGGGGSFSALLRNLVN